MRSFEKAVSAPHGFMLSGMQVSGSSWNAALADAEALASSRDGIATLGFLDGAKLAGALLAPAPGGMSKPQILLPAGGLLVRLMLRAIGGKQAATARFSATSFVPALLTYLGDRRRVAIVGDDAGRLDALCAHFSDHAPWHDFSCFAADARLPGRFDLVIADAGGQAAECRIWQALAGSDIGLVIMAGSGLSRIIDRRPGPARTQSNVSTAIAA